MGAEDVEVGVKEGEGKRKGEKMCVEWIRIKEGRWDEALTYMCQKTHMPLAHEKWEV